MRILLTGSEGKLCTRVVKPALEEHIVIPFDLVLGDDMLNGDSLYEKMKECDVVIHTAGISGPQCKDESLYEKVSVRGGKNVINVARTLEKLVVFFSSMSYYGVDAWMGHRDDTGPVTRAVPRYLPIDTEHPSVASYDISGYGVAYGMSKASIESYVISMDRFVSLRLCGFGNIPYKRKRRWQKMRQSAKRGKAPFRKMWLYSLAGTCTPEVLTEAVQWGVKQKESAVRNVGRFGTGLKDVCRVYFPTLEPADQIFV